MAQKKKVRAAKAMRKAEEVVEILHDACERIEIAGSLRRCCALVGDIEIIAIAKRSQNLFNEDDASLLDLRLKKLRGPSSYFSRVLKDGPRYKQLEIAGGGLLVDLFIVEPLNWGLMLALRTGPAEYSKQLVTPVDRGGRLRSGLSVDRGYVWQGRVKDVDGTILKSGNRMVMKTEREFLQLAGGWVDPVDRR